MADIWTGRILFLCDHIVYHIWKNGDQRKSYIGYWGRERVDCTVGEAFRVAYYSEKESFVYDKREYILADLDEDSIVKRVYDKVDDIIEELLR